MKYECSSRDDFPAVGDWVVVKEILNEDRVFIHAILPRKSKFSRKAAGNTSEEQIVATNVGTVFLVSSLNHDFNLRRIERYLVLAWESGANPVIVLSKADLCDDIEKKVERVKSIAVGVPIHVVSSVNIAGQESVSPYLIEGHTIAIIGSSGVGKSTLINCIVGDDIQKVSEVRQSDGRGRHTTTHRELILIPGGGIIIDTPGMRELHLWGNDKGINKAFADFEELAKQCYYNDCKHRNEPNCAVQLALQEGRLKPKRLANYRNLGGELATLSKQVLRDYQEVEKEKGKKLAKRIIEKERGKRNANFRKRFKKGR